MNNKLIAVVGPTASGKTSLAIDLAEKFGGEIVSCDSMQIYRGMDIGTAKPSAEEFTRVRHHLVGFLDPEVPFSSADYVALAEKEVNEILGRGRLPIIAGGTGLYARSLLYKVDFDDDSRDEALRSRLTLEAEKGGIQSLYDRLMELDGDLRGRIHPNNQKRVIRALEYCLVTGRQFSKQSAESAAVPRVPFLMLGISYRDRQKLYDRINARVELMMDKGLVEEAKEYYNNKLNSSSTSVQAIGYKELFPYFRGETTLEAATENIKRETRRYAKRQLTWFRKERSIRWIYADDFEKGEEFVRFAEGIVKDFLAHGAAAE